MQKAPVMAADVAMTAATAGDGADRTTLNESSGRLLVSGRG